LLVSAGVVDVERKLRHIDRPGAITGNGEPVLLEVSGREVAADAGDDLAVTSGHSATTAAIESTSGTIVAYRKNKPTFSVPARQRFGVVIK